MLCREENPPPSSRSPVFKYDRKQAYFSADGSDRPLINAIPSSTLDSAAALILADSPAIMFEFEGSRHVKDGLPGIDGEILPLFHSGDSDRRPDESSSGVIEGNMVLNIESLIAENGSESTKLWTQAFVTANSRTSRHISLWKVTESRRLKSLDNSPDDFADKFEQEWGLRQA
ncbi:hypothetical protein FP026_29130 [Rhizobium tropici]|uniref:Uncharacterized protein n=1 Tax=Rhizobium tropici TaxID=398 RepID=A0A5B0VMF1_RHITR|nr:hypothetical protein FP026_29130 [Rhizobium tropici]